MKWYESIKVKLIGFFVVISLFFLIFIMASFSLFKESILEKNAVEKARLSTIHIVDQMNRTKIKMEEDVLILASVTAEKYRNKKTSNTLIPALLMNAMGDKHVQSGGVWFEPYMLDPSKKDGVIFFNRDRTKKLSLLEDYVTSNPQNYRQMEFYVLGKQLKEGETFWTKVYTDPITHVRMITVVSPIYHDKTFVGVASIDMGIGHYMENLKEINNSYSMLLDRKGTFVAKSPKVKERIHEKNIYTGKDPKLLPILDVIQKNLQKRKEKIARQYGDKATEISQCCSEISRNDAEMILGIMQERSKSMETKTYFLKNDALLNAASVITIFYFPDTGMSLVVGMSEDVVLEDFNKDYSVLIWITFLSTLLATFLGYLLLKKYFVDPLQSVNRQLENSMLEDGHYRFLKCDDKGEIGQLVYNLNYRTLALEDAQRRERDEIQKRLTNEKLLIQQSKMAAMGEMMDAVAHQWKQPLNALSMYSEIIKSDFEEGTVDQRYVDEFSQNIQIQIDHMVDTLDEFRSFFRPNKENEDFRVSEIIDSVMFLTKDEFMKNRITIDVEKESEIELHGSKNEFKHLILNIINNAKDAFNDNNIEEKRNITIRLIDDEQGRRIEIEDNAGGIPEEVLPDIFKANVTTKEEGKGTGIGLYMSTQIAEKYGAKLNVENRNKGACFIIGFES
ncbi:sensor histidine kinase [Sulfurovum sp. NBC37-1]|uniref:sensor histidine kinase n=1 Tax=Sulfurovum sp. (strain NBC37-1) TaxID=387093 RepID=UPI0001587727|nr:ATP-binding protein [Sulfurovum sp. NBC37-1]BAF71920.1 hypothetical protein SUN_0963 [Sulfurovum sp. NBC37-1]